MKTTDYFSRFIGITLAMDEDKSFDLDPVYTQRFRLKFPWEASLYKYKTAMKVYNKLNIPEWLAADCSNISKIILIPI
jgi:hypothetical protein